MPASSWRSICWMMTMELRMTVPIRAKEPTSVMAHIQPQAPTTLHDEETELQRIEAALKAAGGNKSKAAQLLAVDRKTLYNKMKKYGI